MSLIGVNVTGLDTLRLRLAFMQSELPLSMKYAAGESVQQTSQELSGAAPVGYGTITPPPEGDAQGALSQSFSAEVVDLAPGIVQGTVRTFQPTKLKYLSFGTGIYGPRQQRIYPVRASALAWYDQRLGVLMIRKSVAGIKPNDFATLILLDAYEVAKTNLYLAFYSLWHQV